MQYTREIVVNVPRERSFPKQSCVYMEAFKKFAEGAQ